MAFADWALSSAAPGMIIQWDTILPIEGLHSLVMVGAAGDGAIGYVPGSNSACGRIYAFHKEVDPFSGELPVVPQWGLFAQMQTSFAIGRNAYCLMYFPNVGNKLVISKQAPSTAFSDSTGLAIGVYSGATQKMTEVYAMCLNWQTDPVSGDIALIGAVDGPIADPSTYNIDTLLDSKAIVAYTDGASPYSTGITCGVLAQNSGAFRKAYFDLVSIYTD